MAAAAAAALRIRRSCATSAAHRLSLPCRACNVNGISAATAARRLELNGGSAAALAPLGTSGVGRRGPTD